MRTVTVQSPDGTTWRVRVVWEPRWPALARRYGGWRRQKRDRDLPDPSNGLDLIPPLTNVTGHGGGGGGPDGGGGSSSGGGGGRGGSGPAGAGGHGGLSHGGGGGGFDFGDSVVVGLVVVVGLIVFGFLFWWLLLPLLLLLLDGVVVLVLVVAGVLGRVLFRRPWTVRAAGPGTAERTAQVVGWGAARRARDEMADQLRLGLTTEIPR